MKSLLPARWTKWAERIATTRAEARERNGWIMDSYLLRKEGTVQG
jgi:precorrin-6A synthase